MFKSFYSIFFNYLKSFKEIDSQNTQPPTQQHFEPNHHHHGHGFNQSDTLHQNSSLVSYDNSSPQTIYNKIKRSEFQAIYDYEILENIIHRLKQIGYVNFNYLGEGAFGIVLSAKSLDLMRKVAVKLVRITPELEKSMQNLNDEISILKKYIYHERYEIKKKQFMIQITELCDNSLQDELELLRKHEKSLSNKILDATNFIHQNQIVHRDLKASNIFMKDGVPKIGDFGISTSQDNILKSLKGTPIFMAPEIFEQNYNFPVDIYALGLIFLMIENPNFNYESNNSKLSIHCIQFQQGIIPSELKFNVNSVLYKCAALMIKTNPQERKNIKYYIEYILKHCSQNNIEYVRLFLFNPLFKIKTKQVIIRKLQQNIQNFSINHHHQIPINLFKNNYHYFLQKMFMQMKQKKALFIFGKLILQDNIKVFMKIKSMNSQQFFLTNILLINLKYNLSHVFGIQVLQAMEQFLVIVTLC